jgi:hypothetical protein
VDVGPRLTRWIERSFSPGRAEQVLATLRDLPPDVIGGQDVERIQAALVIDTGGDWDAFQRMLALAKCDWRDLLVSADLGDEGWRDRLDEVLGSRRR